jgi:myo-inositol-1(or 4)-monophosphatase
MITRLQAEEVRELVYRTGEYIRSERVIFQASSVEHKDIHDMVSYVDKTSEKKLIEGIERIVPGSSFRGEESGIHSTTSAYTWIIDPLDGTTNFIHQIPHYCISIGLQFEGKLIAGWVYEICTDEMYTAIQGEGAFLNKKKIEVSRTPGLHQSLIATGFPVREYNRLDHYLQLLKWVIQHTRGVRRLGTAAYDLCLVASGRVEAYYEPGLSAWDVSAGAIIVQEAGGKVTDFKGGDEFLDGAEIIATNGILHDELLRAVQAYMG